MKNKKHITEMFNEIHAPDALSGKVMNMSKKKKQLKRKNLIRHAAGIAAAFALAFLLSNGICYAASGKTWIGTFFFENGEIMHVNICEIKDANEDTELVEENGRIFLFIDGMRVVDITEDFADGKATGTIPLEQLEPLQETLDEDNGPLTYTVTGTIEDYNITLEAEADGAPWAHEYE